MQRGYEQQSTWENKSGLILGLHPANGRRGYKVMPYLIDLVPICNQPCKLSYLLTP